MTFATGLGAVLVVRAVRLVDLARRIASKSIGVEQCVP